MFIKNSEASMKFAFNPVAAAEGKNGSGGVAGAKVYGIWIRALQSSLRLN